MTRLVEWFLGVVGAAITTGIAAVFAQQQSSVQAPGGSLWPFPGIVLLEIAVLGLMGLVAVGLDREVLTWAVVGALVGLMFLGIFSVGPFLFPTVSAFLVAALMADRRKERHSLPKLGLAAVTMIGNAVLLIGLIMITRG
ncbi:MAG: hypothetical protein Q8P00_03565 [Dehalococcoidia bacterium]|nr:hypothetical protein [Dehalococcoidia bacterium]